MKDEMNTNISGDADDQISGLLAGLPRVSAPTDFDLRLRGRIARGRTAASGGFRMPAALAYALGLGVVLIAFGLFGMAYIYSGKVGDVPVVATTATAPIAPVTSAPSAPASSDTLATIKAPEPSPTAAVLKADVKPNDIALSPRVAANNSKIIPSPAPSVVATPDSALKQAKAIYPQGIHPGPAPGGTPDVTTPVKAIDAKEVLAVFGINASSTGGKIRIGSVNAGSAAEVAGLKAGDVVESIDDKGVGASFPGGYIAKTITVIRDGKSIKIAVGK